MSSNNEFHHDIDPCDMTEEQKVAVKIAAMEAMYEKSTAELLAKVEQLELENKAAVAIGAKALAQVAEAGASAAAAPGSGKKIIYTDTMHKTTHAKVVALTAPALLELKKLENNYEAVWWCAKHIEALGKRDKPDGYDKYVTWGNKNMTATSTKEYAPLSAEALAAGSP
jgi:peptidyl-tRNA hydrolase